MDKFHFSRTKGRNFVLRDREREGELELLDHLFDIHSTHPYPYSMAMITSIRREIRNLLRVAPSNEAILEKIKEAETNLDQAICDEHYVNTLCEAIKIKDVDLTTVALQSLKHFIEGPYINAKSLQIITDAVTKTEFTSTESELVEEGYHQAVRVCRAMVKCEIANELTNGSISEIIIFCFRVVNSKLVKWLRFKAARTLISITKIIFRRLGDFPEDPQLKPSYQIRLRLGGTSSQSTFKELTDQSFLNDNSSTTATSSLLRIINERNQPFNLAFINDYFCYLSSLINPSHDTELTKVSEEKIMLGFKLLETAFREAGGQIGHKSCLIYITRNNICYNIVLILKTIRSNPIISSSLNLATDIFIELRQHLKYQFEAFLERLMEMLAAHQEQSDDSTTSHSILNANMELRSDVLHTVLELLRNIPHFPHELYYNYDCDPYSSNIYENLIQICSKNCFQHTLETHFTPIQLTSFKCLLTNLADIYNVEMDMRQYLTLRSYRNQNGDTSQICQTGGESNESEQNRFKFPRTFRDINDAKKRKRLLWLAIEKFNARPKDGIQFIKDNKLIDNNVDLVQFLKDNLRVDKKSLGEFLAKEENKPLRQAFIRSLDFTNLRIDEALRLMLEKFRLPGESQLIERILDTFSIHWFEQNNGILQSSDNALSLAYAIIMLNVDQHSKKVKPMTCDEFDRNLLGPRSERIYDRKLLDLIYTSIRDNEIVLPDEQTGTVRQRYIWRCTMVKNEMYQISELPLVEVNKVLFEIMWSPTVAALSFIFDSTRCLDLSRRIVDQGFIKIALLCAQHGHLDNLVITLCKLSSGQRNLISDKNSLATISLLTIIRDYANCMRDSWSNIIRNILQWYCSKCIDDVVHVDDFALQRKLTLRMREIKKSPSTMNEQSSTFLRQVYTYFAGQQPANERKVQNGSYAAPSAIQVLIQTIQDAEYCQESLVELIKALTTTSIDGDIEEIEDAEVFKLEIFTQVILNNKEQAISVWPTIRAYFARQASICGRSTWLGERIISAAFRVAIQFRPKLEVFSLLGHIISTLDAEIIRDDHTRVALQTLTELHAPNVSMDPKELEDCFNQVIFPFLDKVLDGCDPVQSDRTLNKSINLLSKIFLKHHKILKDLPGFALMWYAILDTMDKYIKANGALKEATFELVKNMVLVMDNEKCMSVEMKDFTRTKFMFWEFQSGSDY